MIEALPERKSLSGHDAYCHVCWEPFYALWVADTPPPNERCVLGAGVAHECPQAAARAPLTAFLEHHREDFSPTPQNLAREGEGEAVVRATTNLVGEPEQ